LLATTAMRMSVIFKSLGLENVWMAFSTAFCAGLFDSLFFIVDRL